MQCPQVAVEIRGSTVALDCFRRVCLDLLFVSLYRRLSSRTKQPITEEEQEFFDSMEENIRKKQVVVRITKLNARYLV